MAGDEKKKKEDKGGVAAASGTIWIISGAVAACLMFSILAVCIRNKREREEEDKFNDGLDFEDPPSKDRGSSADRPPVLGTRLGTSLDTDDGDARHFSRRPNQVRVPSEVQLMTSDRLKAQTAQEPQFVKF